MQTCDLHTILRLPTGIFSSAGIKTNVLFFSKPGNQDGGTEEVWVFDMRTNMPKFSKGTPLEPKHFSEFEECFGMDPLGKAVRADEGESGRFRRFTREDISKRNDNLDITWLQAVDTDEDEVEVDPAEIAAMIVRHLRAALSEMETIVDEFANGEETTL